MTKKIIENWLENIYKYSEMPIQEIIYKYSEMPIQEISKETFIGIVAMTVIHDELFGKPYPYDAQYDELETLAKKMLPTIVCDGNTWDKFAGTILYDLAYKLEGESLELAKREFFKFFKSLNKPY